MGCACCKSNVSTKDEPDEGKLRDDTCYQENNDASTNYVNRKNIQDTDAQCYQESYDASAKNVDDRDKHADVGSEEIFMITSTDAQCYQESHDASAKNIDDRNKHVDVGSEETFMITDSDAKCYKESHDASAKNIDDRNKHVDVGSEETFMITSTDAQCYQESRDASAKNIDDRNKHADVVSEETFMIASDPVDGGEVPPHPPKTKKRVIVPDPTVFKHIDEHALKATSSLRESVSEIANYLVKPAKNNLERVRAFYRWITDNIRYDTEGHFGGITNSCDPNEVLKTRRSVGLGYADLFSAFCREVNIPVKTIKGHAKDYKHNPEVAIIPSKRINHAWNVVLLDGDWRFIECMWGAGHFKAQQFHKQFAEFYFLTDPEDFISEHYPFIKHNKGHDLKWQLLHEPISVKEFIRRVKLTSTALEFGIIPVSHTSGVLELKSDDTITIQDGQSNIESWIINFSLSDGTDMSNYIMSYMQSVTTLKINVRPPVPGKYLLKIFAKPIGKQTAAHNSILKYIIKCSEIAKSAKPYPSRKTPWGFCPEYQQYGFAEKSIAIPIFTANNGKLSINIPTTRQVEVIAKLQHAENRDVILENCTLVESSANKIVVSARLPIEGFYALDIMAKRPWEDGDTYWSSIVYLIDCQISMTPCYPFPECYYGAITKYNCRLLEPLNGSLPAKSSVTFRLESNILQRIRILKHNLRKTCDGIFEGEVDTPDTGMITVFGSEKDSGSLSCLYQFSVAT